MKEQDKRRRKKPTVSTFPHPKRMNTSPDVSPQPSPPPAPPGTVSLIGPVIHIVVLLSCQKTAAAHKTKSISLSNIVAAVTEPEKLCLVELLSGTIDGWSVVGDGLAIHTLSSNFPCLYRGWFT